MDHHSAHDAHNRSSVHTPDLDILIDYTLHIFLLLGLVSLQASLLGPMIRSVGLYCDREASCDKSVEYYSRVTRESYLNSSCLRQQQLQRRRQRWAAQATRFFESCRLFPQS